MKRKHFLATSILGAAGLSFGKNALSQIYNTTKGENANNLIYSDLDNMNMKICIFSKQLQWMNYQDMSNAVAEMGFDGIDLTVRPNGHVLPENVERDLPRAVEAANKAGIKIMMISTDISEASDPITKRILKAAADNDIHYYRMAGLKYQKDMDIQQTLKVIGEKMARLVEINKQYGLHSDYLNHSGEGFGSSIWDLWLTIKDLDPKFIGSQYDIKHSTIAGPFSWTTNFQLIHKHIKTLVIRDFKWKTNGDIGEIEPVPIGKGMVDFKKYFSLIKQYKINGPISLMCDYDLGGAEEGARTLKIPSENVLDAMKKDLITLKDHLKAANQL